jgi:hypothetical protein
MSSFGTEWPNPEEEGGIMGTRIPKIIGIVLISIGLLIAVIFSMSALIVAVQKSKQTTQIQSQAQTFIGHTELCAGLVLNKDPATNRTYGMLGKLNKISSTEIQYMIEVAGFVAGTILIRGPIDLRDSTPRVALTLCGSDPSISNSEDHLDIRCSQSEGIIRGTWNNGSVNRMYRNAEDAVQQIFDNNIMYYITLINEVTKSVQMNVQTRSC